MAVVVFRGSCGTPASMVRQKLKDSGYEKWASLSHIVGRPQQEAELIKLSKKGCENIEEYIMPFVRGGCKTPVVIGYNEESYQWLGIDRRTSPSEIRKILDIYG